MVYKRQAAILLFIGMVVFKVSRLFSMMYEGLGADSWLLISCYLLFEIGLFLTAYYFADTLASDKLEKSKLKWLYYAILCVLAVYLILKSILYFCETAAFCEKYLFEQAPALVVAAAIAAVVLLMLVGGVRSLARTAEVVFLAVLAIFVINLVFIKTDFDITRNLPTLTFGFKYFAAEGFDFWFWTGDLLPFFLLKFSDKKRGRVSIGIVCGAVATVAVYLLTVGVYDTVSVFVDSPMVSIAAYNRLAKVLGGLEIFGILAWLVMAVLQLAFLIWGASEVFERLGLKRTPSAVIATLPSFLTVVFVAVLDNVFELATSNLKYIALCLNVALPFALTILAAVENRKADKEETRRIDECTNTNG